MDGAKVGTYAARGLHAGAGWMDGCLGMGLLACTPILLFPLLMFLLSLCGLVLTTFVFYRICRSARVAENVPPPPPPPPVSFTCFLLGCRYRVFVGNGHSSVLVQIIQPVLKFNSEQQRDVF